MTKPSAVIVFTVLAATVTLLAKDESERFTALAVDMTTRNADGPSRVDIALDAWSTDADREALAIAGDADGTPAVEKLLRDSRRIGYVRISGRIGSITVGAQIAFHRDDDDIHIEKYSGGAIQLRDVRVVP